MKTICLNLLLSYGGYQYGPKDEPDTLLIVMSIFCPVFLFGLYFLYLRYTQKHKIISWLGKEMPSAYSDFSFREIQIVLAVAMIKRDLVLFMSKRSRIHQLVGSYASGKKLDVDELIDFFMDVKIPLVDLLEWCNAHASYEQKLQTFSFLAQISLIDNELVDPEREYLLFIIRKFAIRNQDISEELQEYLFESNRKKPSEPKVKFHSCFEILEIHATASAKEIKEAYRKLVKKFHPDSHPDLSSDEKKQLAERFQQVQDAYDELMSV